jgi:hypothetical protein
MARLGAIVDARMVEDCAVSALRRLLTLVGGLILARSTEG